MKAKCGKIISAHCKRQGLILPRLPQCWSLGTMRCYKLTLRPPSSIRLLGDGLHIKHGCSISPPFLSHVAPVVKQPPLVLQSHITIREDGAVDRGT